MIYPLIVISDSLVISVFPDVRSVGFSPDGNWIVSGSDNKKVRILDAETGAAIGRPFQGHTNYVFSVASSPDGRRIMSGSRDRYSSLNSKQKEKVKCKQYIQNDIS